MINSPNSKQPKQQSPLNLEHDLYDSTKYNQTKQSADILSDAENLHKGDWELYPELLEDSFYSFFQYQPTMKPTAEVDPLFHLNRNILQDMQMKNEFEQLRGNTKLNEGNAATAAATLTDSLITENKPIFEQLNKYVKQLKDAQQNVSNIQGNLQKLQQQQQNPNLTPSQKQQCQNQINYLQQQLQKPQQNLTQAQQQIGLLQPQINVGSAVQQAKDAVEFQAECFGWGDTNGSFTPVNYQDRIAFQNALLKNKMLLQIMRAAGRMRRMATRKQRQKTKQVPDEICDIIYGKDILHMLPMETMLMNHPELKTLFLAKYAENKLLCYDLQGTETKGKGPIVVCLDVSGSMGGPRDCWAKGVSLACVEIAHKERRNAVVIVFDHVIQAVFNFPKTDFSYSEMLKLASYYTGGGTDFDPPLEKAMEVLENEKDFKEGDLLMVTDGQANLSSEVRETFLELKTKLKFHMQTIVIGPEYDGFIEHALMKPVSDQLTSVAELTDEVAGNIFESL